MGNEQLRYELFNAIDADLDMDVCGTMAIWLSCPSARNSSPMASLMKPHAAPAHAAAVP